MEWNDAIGALPIIWAYKYVFVSVHDYPEKSVQRLKHIILSPYFLCRISISMWFAASGFQDILLSQFLPQLFIFFFLYSPIVHSYVTDWIFNFSLILCTIQAKHARAICWKITAGGDLSFLFFKSINMLWKIPLRLKTVDLVHWIVHDEMCKERGFLFLLYFKNKAWVR